MADRTVIEWDKDDIDALGILKVDCLALGMLTCIAKCLKLLNDRRAPLEQSIELHTIPAEDPAVYEMVSNADTIGVFQIESRAQMSMLPRLRPREFYDLVIEVAIVRPGPIQGDMVHPYLRRRNGEEKVEYPSEDLRQVLGKTLGVPLFQEQAMKVAMVAAGFSAEEADQLRRAMAAWRYHGSIEKFHRKMVDGMLANGYKPEFAEQCFNQIKGFGEYGFPESHAASFALLVYASAWIKCHHPAVFACGLLNSQPMGFYAPAQIVRDAREHGVIARPVDVNYSQWDCTLEQDQSLCLRLGFRAIKGMSKIHAERIVSSRSSEFTTLAEFQRRTKLPRHVLERLAHADAFNSLKLSRRDALWQVVGLDDATPSLFEAFDEETDVVGLPVMPAQQEVMTDYAMAGLSLKQHPVSFLRDELTARKIARAAELVTAKQGRWIQVAGLVLIRQRPGTASGIVFVTIEDETGIANLIIKPDVYDRCRAAARHASLLQADGNVERQGQVVHIMVKRLHDLSSWLAGDTPKSRDFH
jgi:error-prone DNA polymerase